MSPGSGLTHVTNPMTVKLRRYVSISRFEFMTLSTSSGADFRLQRPLKYASRERQGEQSMRGHWGGESALHLSKLGIAISRSQSGSPPHQRQVQGDRRFCPEGIDTWRLRVSNKARRVCPPE